MDLNRSDKDMLQLLAIEVSWPMVCGEFHESYGSVEALVKRLFEFKDQGLVQITSSDDKQLLAVPAALCSEAENHGNYNDIELMAESGWSIAATNKGYALIKTELDEQ